MSPTSRRWPSTSKRHSRAGGRGMSPRKTSILTVSLVVVLVLALAIFAAACGGEKATTTTAAPAGTVTTAASGGTPTGDPIKVGAPLPLTGAYAADGEHMQY